MKASTSRDNQSHDDVTVSIAAEIVLRNLTTPSNADQDGCVSRQLVVEVGAATPLDERTWRFQQLLTWANDRLRKTEKSIGVI